MITNVLLVDLYERPPGLRFDGSSLPGHLVQLMRTGVAAHEVGGRQYTLCPGDVIWYHEDEAVSGEVLIGPWSFYTVNFIAPTLPPPPFDRRVRKPQCVVDAQFNALLRAWRNTAANPAVRELRVQSRLLGLLADIEDGIGLPYQMDASARLWWELESRLRRDLTRPISLHRMTELTGRSVATINRACHEAVGLPPLKRIKQVKMSLARGLVRQSDLRIGEIADRIGYSRVHEFSRDYHRYYGIAPSDDRRHPD
ncbi:MAG TPA: AraC family transcriptional regulator [Mycobacteriales bacterium]|nr:AraC family transcriptional regulator [Mycobacteriales bacterium]